MSSTTSPRSFLAASPLANRPSIAASELRRAAARLSVPRGSPDRCSIEARRSSCIASIIRMAGSVVEAATSAKSFALRPS